MESDDLKFLGGKVPVTGISVNVDVHLIQITEDRLKNILVEHQSNVATEKNWVTPLCLLLSFLLALTTTEAKEIFGVSSSTWEALFIGVCIMSVIWLVVSVKNIRTAMSIEQLIRKIKNN